MALFFDKKTRLSGVDLRSEKTELISTVALPQYAGGTSVIEVPVEAFGAEKRELKVVIQLEFNGELLASSKEVTFSLPKRKK